ncbi:MAG TPA: CapA family protein [Solirubrobacterales bacterium]|nr:CapA family protein [Solirubrobacterales bacterium]
MLALLPAIVLAALLCGCFDGTVRNPPREASAPPSKGHKKAMHEKQGSEKKQASDGKDKVGAVTLSAVGDTAMGVTPTLPPDPASYLDPISGQLVGDAVFGNLEGTLTDVSEDVKCGGADPGTCFAFRAPPEYAKYLADAGFTVMNLANNHSYDFGDAGQEETIEALRGAGIKPTGLPAEATYVTIGDHRVAFLGFAPYEYTNSLTDLETARALIREARKRADIVVVAIHAGAEGSDALHVSGEEEIYLGEDRGNPEAFAQMAIEAGADLVLGSGPHVLRGMEIYRGRLIAYSLGNFSGYHNFTLEGVLGESAVLHVTMAADGSFRAGRIASVSLIEEGQPVLDPEERAASLIAELSQEDFGSKGIEVGADGRIEP